MDVDESLGRRTWATILTGVPFAIFKLGAGAYLHSHVSAGLGVALITWGALDMLLNGLSLVAPATFSYCVLSNVGRQVDRRRSGARGWEPVCLALDTLLAFIIVATMIWFRLFPELPPLLARIWDGAVVANVVGVGVERVWRTWPAPEEPEAAPA